MGIFYNPPLPPTANNAGTPPEPHVPVGNQGTSVPPRRGQMFAATMAILVAAWPADLEPRLQRPNDQQTKIAPLTLAYGAQPPKFSIAARMAQAVAAWPPDLEPRLGSPNERQQKIAPLTRVYGAQPPPIPPLAIAELFPIVASWQESWSAQRAPISTAWILPISPYLAHTPLPSLIWTAWEQPPLPPPRPVAIAPLTLTYGAQPIPPVPLSVVEFDQTYRTWLQTWDAQTAPKSAAWNVPPLVETFVPSSQFRYDILSTWIQTWNAQSAPETAPLTLTYGAQPIPPAPLSVVELDQIHRAWIQTWDAQTAFESAAWNIPPVVAFVPFSRVRYDILIASQDPVTIVFVQSYVVAQSSTDEPPQQSALSPANQAIVQQAWIPAPLAPPPLRPTAAWNPTLVARVPRTVPLSLILAAWIEPFVRPPAPVTIAPLALTYGTQPIPQSAISTIEIDQIYRTWLQTWDAQSASETAGWNVPPILTQVPNSIFPVHILRAWQETWDAQTATENAGWNVPPLVTQVPISIFPVHLLRAWQEELIRLPRPVTIAPLTFVYGAQPIIGPQSTPTRIILQSWPLDLEPRLGKPNAERVRITPLTLVYGNQPPPRAPLSVAQLEILQREWRQDPIRLPKLILLPQKFVSHATFIDIIGSYVPIIDIEGSYIVVIDIVGEQEG